MVSSFPGCINDYCWLRQVLVTCWTKLPKSCWGGKKLLHTSLQLQRHTDSLFSHTQTFLLYILGDKMPHDKDAWTKAVWPAPISTKSGAQTVREIVPSGLFQNCALEQRLCVLLKLYIQKNLSYQRIFPFWQLLTVHTPTADVISLIPPVICNTSCIAWYLQCRGQEGSRGIKAVCLRL